MRVDLKCLSTLSRPFLRWNCVPSIHQASPSDTSTGFFRRLRSSDTKPYLGRVLENDGGWCDYVPEKRISRYALEIPKDKNFVTYLDDDRIQTILLSPLLINYAEAKGERSFLDLVTYPDGAGWSKEQLTPELALLSRTSGADLAANLFTGTH